MSYGTVRECPEKPGSNMCPPFLTGAERWNVEIQARYPHDKREHHYRSTTYYELRYLNIALKWPVLPVCLLFVVGTRSEPIYDFTRLYLPMGPTWVGRGSLPRLR